MTKSAFYSFLFFFHVRHINPVKEHAEGIKDIDRELASNFNSDGIKLPVQEKDFKKVEVENNICFC